MNKIKLMYDVVKAMKEKDVLNGSVKIRGTKDSVEVFKLDNEFQKNLSTGQTRAKITTMLDHDGKQVKHESSTEFCMGEGHADWHRGCGKSHRFHRHHGGPGGGIKGKLAGVAFILNAINNMKVEEQADKSAVVMLNLSEVPEDLKAEFRARMAEKHHGEQCLMKGVTAVENLKIDLTARINKNSEIERVLLAASGKMIKENQEANEMKLNAELNLA